MRKKVWIPIAVAAVLVPAGLSLPVWGGGSAQEAGEVAVTVHRSPT